MEIREKIIDYLTRNRVSTTEVADCLGKTGVIPNLMPCTSGHYRRFPRLLSAPAYSQISANTSVLHSGFSYP